MPVSTFTTDLEGWTATNSTQTFDVSEGDPAGSLRGTEGGSGVWYFAAPDAFLGDMSAYYGGSINFEMKQDIATSQFDDVDIILTGAGLKLVLDMGNNPGTDWTSYSVNLALGGGWRLSTLDGSVASEAQIRSVLENVETFWVRGEFVEGTTGDASNLDNFAVTTQPATPPEYVGVRIDSTFDTGIDGWSFVADVKEFDWVATGGNPGGYIEAVDYAYGDVWYFVAPEKFLGDKSAYAGGDLQFDLKQSSLSSQFDDEDVVITGGGKTIVLNTVNNPGLDWTHYAVTLDTDTDWRLNSVSGAVASQADIDTVLSDVTSLWIRGEYVSGSDTGGLDNVVLTPDVAPVRVLSDTTLGLLLSNHDTLEEALAVTEDGNVVQINRLTAVTLPSYTVTDNGLTVVSNRAIDAVLRLDGVNSLTLSGDNDLDVVGNVLVNTLVGSDGNNTLRGFGGRDTLIGGEGRDLLRGGNMGDQLLGEVGNDRLLGENGNDTLRGGVGRDVLDGGNGNDRLYGGLGADTFRFADGFGVDKIFGFAALNDLEKIDLSAVTEITDFTDLVDNHMSQVGLDVVIDATGGNVITLVGTQIGDLDALDFLF
ncbi:MAG: laminin B domain-containing protein [Pseudodonghicola sp.]